MVQLNFSRGEITPHLHARVDLPQYKAGLQTMRNWVPLRYGGMTRMPGTIYGGFAKTAAKMARFLPFQFNRQQCYAIEAGDLYFRFWNNSTRGRVESPPGTAVEIVTPYTEADLPFLQVRQSGDLVFIVCSGYWPRVLTRNSETSWALSLYVPLDGPYLDLNLTSTTLDPSATSGSVTIVASAITGINGGTGFQTSDIGRAIRFLEAAGRWYWFVITARASTTSVTATYMGRDDGNTAAMPGHAASANWRLGAWSVYDGYPQAIGLYEERLIFAATERAPTTVWGTIAQDTGFDDYGTSAPLVADDAFTAKLTGSLNAINWIADGKDILLGTEGAIRRLGRNDESGAFGPTNLRQKPETSISTSYIPGFFIQNALMFLDVYRTKLYEAIYQNEEQGYVPREISALNEHLLGQVVTDYAYQASPNSVLWMVTENGALLAATYDRDQEIFGVSQCDLGGFVEAVLALPGIDVDGDVLWFVVRRVIGGATVRTIETLSAFYRQSFSAQLFPIYGHCAGFYNDTQTNEVTGLDDFEGETYGVWADGIDVGDVTVVDGTLTLPNELDATRIVWGLRQSSLARTLRITDLGDGRPVMGQPAVAGAATVDVYETPFLRLGTGDVDTSDYDNGLDPVRWRGQSENDPYAEAPYRTEAAQQGLDSTWNQNGVFVMETNSMHPATIRAVTVDVQGAD
jgi:hypothetical protein